MKLKQILKLLRVHQWSKNLLVFAGIIFAKHLFIIDELVMVILSFFCFCVVASSVYVFNDLVDIKYDKNHPVKRERPLASGKISRATAIFLFIFLLAVGVVTSFFISLNFGLLIILYVVIHYSYSLWLKNIVILDILSVASGYVIRAVAGALVIDVEISSWLLVCSALLALLLVLGKRRQELVGLKKGNVTRPILDNYSLSFVDQMINAVAASVITAYFLYSFSDVTVSKMGTKNIGLTTIFVLYGIFRYLFLIHHKGLGEAPEKIALTDAPFLINLALWIISVLIIVY
ncbi:decaprenyl-phosphate phosphoribosyltransferase [bacterium]|nr:decaprenyl-phosphate phosphoribosyltransferase [bacterium]